MILVVATGYYFCVMWKKCSTIKFEYYRSINKHIIYNKMRYNYEVGIKSHKWYIV